VLQPKYFEILSFSYEWSPGNIASHLGPTLSVNLLSATNANVSKQLVRVAGVTVVLFGIVIQLVIHVRQKGHGQLQPPYDGCATSRVQLRFLNSANSIKRVDHSLEFKRSQWA